MAASAGVITGLNEHLYLAADGSLIDADPDSSETFGSGKLVEDANLVGKVTNIGDLTQNANTGSQEYYGEPTADILTFPATVDAWTVAVAVRNDNAGFVALRGMDIGAVVSACVLYKTDDTEQTAVLVKGKIASKSRTFALRGVSTLVLGITPDSGFPKDVDMA